MEISGRIKEIQTFVANANISLADGSIVQQQLTRLKAEIAAALQAARQEGYLTGYRDGYSGGYGDGVG